MGDEAHETTLPHDVQIELNDDPGAAAVFEALPYSHKREYIDWILTARRPETRTRRIGQMLKMLAEKAPPK
jgi:uncharacterized protein YdeI (YjbR/CyaY-like superfamily)